MGREHTPGAPFRVGCGHAHLARGRGLSDQAREFFRCHDAAHVVFACSTELLNEGMIKMWSFFGTDAGIRRLLSDYNLPESQEIYATLPWRDVVRTAIRSPAASDTRMRSRP